MFSYITARPNLLMQPSHGIFLPSKLRNIDSLTKNTDGSLSHLDNTSINNTKHNDQEFPPVPEHVRKYNEKTLSQGVELRTIVSRWLRPEQIRWPDTDEKYPLTVFNQPHPMDIIQGRLGNCWFASALSLIAEIPQVLEKIIITRQYNPHGIYKIRLCNRGIWQVITIDDMLPVTQTNTLVFTRSRKRQLFASLIEKALAKTYGSYDALESGRCVEGLQILTGEPCEVLYLRSSDPKKRPNLDQIWAKMIESRSKGYLMTCLCSNAEINEHVFHQMGLEADHAYSVLDARQVGSQRLLRLRNPWGTKGKNDLSNINSTKSSSILDKKSSNSSENDGVFWMPWERITSFLADITICKINTHGHKARRTGQFGDFSSTITSVYSLDCPYGAELDIELFNGSKGPDVDLFLIVLDSNGSCQAYKHGIDYYITLSTTISSGRYIIFAGSMSTINYSVRSKFNLVVHCSQSFTLNEKPLPCEFVGNAFHAVANQAKNRKEFGDGVSLITFNDIGGFGFVCENKSNRVIRLTTDFQGSVNVISSRKTFRMVDTIPAKTKQLFAMFTRKASSRDVNIVYQVQYEALNQLRGTARIGAKNDPPIQPQVLGLHVLKRTNPN